VLALAQMRVAGGDIDGNLRRLEQWIARAADAGAEVVLLPEAADLGWTHPSARVLAQPVPGGRFCEAVRAAARRHRMFVCVGLTEEADGSVFNAAILVSPAGEILLHHRKLNELEIGHACYDQGDRLAVAKTPLGAFGLMICADGYTNGQFVSRTLGLMGADVILSPSAWAVPPQWDNAKTPYGADWRENYGAVARAFRLWIAGCSSVGLIHGGPWDGHSCIGCSLVVDPKGKPVCSGMFGRDAEELLTIEIKPQPRPARGAGWNSYWAGHR
jgi:predicted amidohydrolase